VLWFLEVRLYAQHLRSQANQLSTGIDTQPIVVPLRQFGKELSRGLPSLPPTPPLVSAPHARLLVSWWNQEVRIWRIKPQDDGAEKPKVVARLALQDEENITSVSITQDGGLLAVSSVRTVKLFQLLQPHVGTSAGLRIRKLEMPAITGARTVKLTADGKWLSTVSATNEIQLVRIVRADDSTDAPRALAKLQYLHRLHRDDVPQTPLGGPSGAYERSIAHAEFSSDGNVFAVVDLAGYVDTWVIQGHEDSTAPEIDIDDAVRAVTEDDESDDDEEELRNRIVFLGQRWIRNPSGHLIPRLDSTPVLLSFQPTSDEANRPQPNGNPAVHPTRHNPHPHSHDLPCSEHRLLLVSAEHQLYLFDVLAGRLSEWSRRNPSSSYPRDYRQLDLPAKGCIWDVKETQQRLWLYGEKWVFMFDLAKDFTVPASDSATSKKRKFTGKHNSGAGDAIPHQDLPVTKMRKFDGRENHEANKVKWLDVNTEGRSDADDDEDDADENNLSLATLRRSGTQDEQTNGSMVNGEPKELSSGGEVVDQPMRKESWWHTFKYRPILGILPIGGEDSQAPEVVLVERPSWDLDLPPRFVGTHEK
jgi:U3 small nucleolar RNA-associated protein 4